MFNPRLEDAAEAELFGKRHEPEHAEKKGADLPDRLGTNVMGGIEEPGERIPDQEEVEEVDGAGLPLFAIGDEAVSGFVDAALQHQRHHRDQDERDVAEQDEIVEILELGVERSIDGVEEFAEDDGGDEGEKGQIEDGRGGEHDIPQAECEGEGGKADEAAPFELDGAAATGEIREHGGQQRKRDEAGSGETFAQRGERGNQIKWIFDAKGGYHRQGCPADRKSTRLNSSHLGI